MEAGRSLHNILNQSLQITLECSEKAASHNCLECSGFGLFNHSLALCLYYNCPERYPSCMVEPLKSYFVSENFLRYVELGRSVMLLYSIYVMLCQCYVTVLYLLVMLVCL